MNIIMNGLEEKDRCLLLLLPGSIYSHIIKFLFTNQIEYNANSELFFKTVENYLNSCWENEKHRNPINIYIDKKQKKINDYNWKDLLNFSLCTKRCHELIYDEYLKTVLIPSIDHSLAMKKSARRLVIQPSTGTQVKYLSENLKQVVLGDDFNESLKFNETGKLIHIVFGGTYNKTLSMLPKTLLFLEFTFSSKYNLPFVENTLPEKLKYLKFGASFNQRINADTLPQGLVSLSFGYYFNQDIDIGMLHELRYLVFGKSFNKPLCGLPKNIRTIRFGESFNQEIKKNTLPVKLTELVFGSNFNQRIDIDILPHKITNLYFSCQFNQPLIPGALPKELIHLKFGHSFNQIIPEMLLPKKLSKLHLGYMFNQPLSHGSLPVSLKYLLFNDTYDQLIEQIVLPENLSELVLGNEFKGPLKK